MTKIKICGLSRLEDIEYVNELRPNYVGFVFAKSKRQITREHAVTLRMSLDESISPVGVFVDELPKIVGAYAEDGIIDYVQLHGHETNNYIRNLRFQTGCEIIQAFSIKCGDDLKRAGDSEADYILLDNGAGGTGQQFDWELLEKMERPYFLAGGLNPDNVAEAVQRFHPYAVDISSGVETGGRKDKSKIQKCIRRIRNV